MFDSLPLFPSSQNNHSVPQLPLLVIIRLAFVCLFPSVLVSLVDMSTCNVF